MSAEATEQPGEESNDPKAKESFRKYASKYRQARDANEPLVGSLLVHGPGFFDEYLNRTKASTVLIHALIFFILSGLLSNMGSVLLTSMNNTNIVMADGGASGVYNSGSVFWIRMTAGSASLSKAVGGLLAVWAVGRLIADAIKEGAKL